MRVPYRAVPERRARPALPGRREALPEPGPADAQGLGAGDIGLSAADLAELDALPAPQGARY